MKTIIIILSLLLPLLAGETPKPPDQSKTPTLSEKQKMQVRDAEARVLKLKLAYRDALDELNQRATAQIEQASVTLSDVLLSMPCKVVDSKEGLVCPQPEKPAAPPAKTEPPKEKK